MFGSGPIKIDSNLGRTLIFANLLGHGNVLHSRLLSGFPIQGFPPLSGSGLVQGLILEELPPPQE